MKTRNWSQIKQSKNFLRETQSEILIESYLNFFLDNSRAGFDSFSLIKRSTKIQFFPQNGIDFYHLLHSMRQFGWNNIDPPLTWLLCWVTWLLCIAIRWIVTEISFIMIWWYIESCNCLPFTYSIFVFFANSWNWMNWKKNHLTSTLPFHPCLFTDT